VDGIETERALNSGQILPAKPSVERAVLRASVALAAAGVLVKLAGAAKECVVAGVYGRGDAIEAFMAAALLPALLVNLISESMNQAFLPTLIRVRMEEGAAAAQRLYAHALGRMCVLLAAVTVGVLLASHAILPLIASGYGEEKLALTRHLFYALLPLAVISGVASNCTAVLNAMERFLGPALAPLAISAAILIGAPLLAPYWGIWALAATTLAGVSLHAVLMLVAAHRCGYRFALRWSGADRAAREVASQYGPIFFSGLVASGGLLADQAMAAALPAGSVATLAYANRFVSVILNLLAGALSTSLTPYFSRLAAESDWKQCRAAIRHWVRLSALVSLAATVLLILASRWLVRIAFEHGAFQARDTAAVAWTLALYALQIPFFVCSRVHYRFLLVRRRSDLIFYCGAVNLVLDIVLNLILMRFLGVAGIALATSLWCVATYLLLSYWSRRQLASSEA
jgi:putative peptidoglycan lipid II flippase